MNNGGVNNNSGASAAASPASMMGGAGGALDPSLLGMNATQQQGNASSSSAANAGMQQQGMQGINFGGVAAQGQQQQPGGGQVQPVGGPGFGPSGQIHNPMQMLQAIQGNMQALQRQWAALTTQPESPRKQQAQQHLGVQMKRLRAMQQQAMTALQAQGGPQGVQAAQLLAQQQAQQQQHQQQQQQQQQQSQGQPNFAQQNQQQQQAQQQQQQQNGQPGAASNGGPPQPVGDGAHQAQLAALQAFAQQQRVQQQTGPGLSAPTPQGAGGAAGGNDASGSTGPGAPGGGGGEGGQAPAAPRDFVQTVRTFMQQKGTPLPPTVSLSFSGPSVNPTPAEPMRTIELQQLFASVINAGGSARVSAMPGGWAGVAQRFGMAATPPTGMAVQDTGEGMPSPEQVPMRLARFFAERLGAFEQFWMSRLRNNGPPPPPQQQQQQGQQQQQQGAALGGIPGQNGAPPVPGAQSGGMPVNLQQAQRMQAALPAQMQQLQQLVANGRMTMEQAKARLVQLQQSVQGAFAMANAGAAAMPPPPGQQVPQNAQQAQQIQQAQQMQAQQQAQQQQQQQQQRASVPPPQGQQPGQMQGMWNGAPPQQQQQQQQSQQGFSQGNAPAHTPTMPPAAPPAPQAATPKTEARKPAKRPRKSTVTASEANSTPGPEPALPEAGAPPSAGAAPGNESFAPQPQPPQQQQQAATQAQMQQAQQAMQALQRGNLTRAQQEAAFAAVRAGTAGMNPAAQAQAMAMAQMHAAQAPAAPGPLGVAAPATPTNLVAAMQQQAAQTMSLAPGLGSAAAQALAGLPEVDVKPKGKFKIEYLPIQRELKSHGGWDLDQIKEVLGPALDGRGRMPRTVRELGMVDVHALTMSLRSRIETEVAYAINALYILSAGIHVPQGSYSFPLEPCEDLLDELLELLEESAFGRDEVGDLDDDAALAASERAAEEEGRAAPAVLTQRDWVTAALEHEEGTHMWKRRVRRTRSVLNLDDDLPSSRKRRAVSKARSIDDDVQEVDPPSPAASERAAAANGTTSEAPNEDASFGPAYYARLREEREAEQSAGRALAILDLLRNFAMMEENVVTIATHPRAIGLLAFLCASVERETQRLLRDRDASLGGGTAVPSADDGYEQTVFTPAEALRVRKDTLSIISGIAGEHLRLANLGRAATLALFDLIVSFVVDAADIEQSSGVVWGQPQVMTPHGSPPPMQRQEPVIVSRKVPHHADEALDAFAKLALPDENREILGSIVPGAKLVQFGLVLVKLLPVTDLDFKLIKTEARLAYYERTAMSLYNLAFLAPPQTKIQLRDTPGTPGVVFRIVKRLVRVAQEYDRNPFCFLIRRLVESLRLISDANDLFAGTSQRQDGPGVLVGELMTVLEIYAIPHMDAGLVAELDVMM